MSLMNKGPAMSRLQEALASVVLEALLELAIEAVQKEFAGESVYFPKTVERESRNAEIKNRFDGGTTVRQLAADFGLTRMAVYNILKKQQKV